MNDYYVNKHQQRNGDHEVHIPGCRYMPDVENREYLGTFASCRQAVQEAKNRHYSNVNGCKYCCLVCHTS